MRTQKSEGKINSYFIFLPFYLDALALAANQDIGHAVRSVAGFRKRRKRAMPAGVVRVVARGTSLAVITLATAGAVQDDLMRPGQPVFIDKEIHSVRLRPCGLADQAGFGGNFLEFRSSVATHGQHRQAI